MNFSKVISKIREKEDLTQKELALILNVAPSTVNAWEKGTSNPSDDLKVIIANKYNLSMDYLFGIVSEYSSNEIDNKLKLLTDKETILIESLIDYMIKNK